MPEYTSLSYQPSTFPASLKDVTPVQYPLKQNISTESPQYLPLQRKLSIGSVDDPLEDEADAMADKVMRMPDPNFIQRKCAHCKEEDAKVQRKPLTPFIQKKGSGNNNFANHAISSQIQSTKGNGNTMPDSTRNFMESRFDADFSNVNIHTGNYASQLSNQLNAQAFTVGSEIYFNEGKYAPESSEGKHLLAHELTHVIQQKSNVHRFYALGQQRVSKTKEFLQRQPAPQQAQPAIKFRIGWLISDGVPVETNGQVDAIARLVITSLQDDLADVSSDTVKSQITGWISTVKGVLPYFDRHANEKVDSAIIPLINHQYDELLQIQEAMRLDKLFQIKEALWRERNAAIEAAKQAEALQPALDDALRAAYRKGSSNTLKDVTSTVKGALSVGRNIRTLAADITTDIMNLPLASGTKISVDHWSSQIGTPKITIINVNKYTEKLAKLGRALSAFNVVLTIADRKKRTTEAEQGMKDLSDSVNIGTDLVSASPLSAPPHFSLYSTLYLKPALKIIAKQIGVLVENLSDVNRISVEITGDLMYPNSEPGGQEMFDLMVKIMHANAESEFPTFSGGVKKYLFEHREKLSTGAEAEVPTEGWIWRDLDIPAARRWLFTNRQRVWAMFYGSLNVPASKF